jgi:hypothetical protein
MDSKYGSLRAGSDVDVVWAIPAVVNVGSRRYTKSEFSALNMCLHWRFRLLVVIEAGCPGRDEHNDEIADTVNAGTENTFCE